MTDATQDPTIHQDLPAEPIKAATDPFPMLWLERFQAMQTRFAELTKIFEEIASHPPFDYRLHTTRGFIRVGEIREGDTILNTDRTETEADGVSADRYLKLMDAWLTFTKHHPFDLSPNTEEILSPSEPRRYITRGGHSAWLISHTTNALDVPQFVLRVEDNNSETPTGKGEFIIYTKDGKTTRYPDTQTDLDITQYRTLSMVTL